MGVLDINKVEEPLVNKLKEREIEFHEKYRTYHCFIFDCYEYFIVNHQKNIIIIGHRGAKGHIAENTLPSIAKAIDLG